MLRPLGRRPRHGLFCVGSLLPCLLPLLLAPATAAADDRLSQASSAAAGGEHRRAIELLDAALAENDKLAEAYYLRGRSRFCVAEIDAALADFDRYVALRPEREREQWERGITCYYAGQFEKGARQFELYQTYHDNDVENSVWRYLCLVPQVGQQEARKTMLPIRADPRIPMMKIYDLYRGKASVQDVLADVETGNPTDEQRQARLFYARLYIGLYYDSLGEKELARPYLQDAARQHETTVGINRYMWSVANVHGRVPARQKNKPE
jgi:lipoprotein NlpI